MCEKRIEKAASAVDGVSKTDWNKKSKILEVAFDDTKTTTDKIEVAIAKVGHDTEMHKTANEVHKKPHPVVNKIVLEIIIRRSESHEGYH